MGLYGLRLYFIHTINRATVLSWAVQIIKWISLIILIAFYLIAGVNHFHDPESYYHVIPHYLPFPVLVNILAGCFELLFGLLLILPKTRIFAAWGIVLMLIAFLPVHISMIGDAPLQLGNLTVTPFIAWTRLVVVQPLLVLWAWWYTKKMKAER